MNSKKFRKVLLVTDNYYKPGQNDTKRLVSAIRENSLDVFLCYEARDGRMFLIATSDNENDFTNFLLYV